MYAIQPRGFGRTAAAYPDILTCLRWSQNGHLIRSVQTGRLFLYSPPFADRKFRWLSHMFARIVQKQLEKSGIDNSKNEKPL